jgi:uncharacterized protein YqeY
MTDAEGGGNLKVRLAEDLREAMKARDKVRLGAVRLLAAAVKNREVELGHALSDDEFVQVATREVKRRREAIEAYASAGREDRADIERQEQAALEAYVPPALSEVEVEELIDEAIAATGAAGPGDLGKVMGQVMDRAKGRTDGKLVQAKVRARLGAGASGS